MRMSRAGTNLPNELALRCIIALCGHAARWHERVLSTWFMAPIRVHEQVEALHEPTPGSSRRQEVHPEPVEGLTSIFDGRFSNAEYAQYRMPNAHARRPLTGVHARSSLGRPLFAGQFRRQLRRVDGVNQRFIKLSAA